MKERFYLLFLYFVFWLVYFLAARGIFLSYHVMESKDLTLELVFMIFKQGIRQDISAAAYLSFIPFMLVSLEHFIKKSVLETLLYTYTLVLVFILTFIIVIDLEVYNVWKFRLDGTPLAYLSTPREAWVSVKASPIFQLVLSYIILLIIASYFVYRVLANRFDNWKHIGKFPYLIVGLLLTAALIIPMRGGWQAKPLKSDQLYFSSNYFANSATLNAPWHFFESLSNLATPKLNPFAFLPRNEVKRQLSQLFVSGKNNPATPLIAARRPNVILIVCESLSQRNLGLVVDGKPVAPTLTKLSKEGIYFENMYAAGDHTEEGILALLNGYPSLPNKSIIMDNDKLANLNYLTHWLNKANYQTDFYYGGKTDFMNLKGYLDKADFKFLYDAPSFPAEQQNSAWGVSDGDLFQRFLQNHQKVSGRFFSTILTVSSHESYEIPTPGIFSTNRPDNAYLNAINYLDTTLGDFLSQARKQPWWASTLVIIVADHSHRYPIDGGSKRVSQFKIPMIWTGGVITNSATFRQVISQKDVPALLQPILGYDKPLSTFTKNPMQSKQPAWAFFSFNNGFGFVNSKGYVLYDNSAKRVFETNLDATQTIPHMKAGQALQQASFNDYLNR